MRGTLIVTGGSRGIGAAVAGQASDRGYTVAVNYRHDADAAAAVVAAITESGGQAHAICADVANENQVAALFAEAQRQLGPVTALANCAGITGKAGRFEDVSLDTLREVIDINTLGCMLCCREAVRFMSTQRGGAGGAIVNVSTGAATLGSANQYVWYAASKAAVDAFSLGLAREVMADGIRVNAVSPGIVDTDIHADSGIGDRLRQIAADTPIGRMARPDEVANAILWLLSDAASYCVGTNLRVAGGR